MTMDCDIIIIGAGIGGAGAAWALAPYGRVVLLEAEAQAGYHTTGRSAAFYAETYGGLAVQPLTTASKEFLRHPPTSMSATPFLERRGAWHVFGAGEGAEQHALYDSMKHLEGVRIIPGAEVQARVPLLAGADIASAVTDADCGDLDVAGLHQAYLKAAKQAGVTYISNARVEGLAYREAAHGGHWHVQFRGHSLHAPIVVNAAGAWADEVAALARSQSQSASGRPAKIGLEPRRRTVVLAEVAEAIEADWPLVLKGDETLYIKAESGHLLLCPSDETLSPPCDAQPDIEDIAITIDRFERMTGVNVKRVTHKWAGLRTFAPDRIPVIGWDAEAKGFFWCAGQGGFGIQTSPAWSALAARVFVCGQSCYSGAPRRAPNGTPENTPENTPESTPASTSESQDALKQQWQANLPASLHGVWDIDPLVYSPARFKT